VIPEFFGVFLEQFPEWSNPENAPTIFNHPEAFCCAIPLLRFQEETSSVCYLVSITNLIYDSICLHAGTKNTEAVEHYALNIGRFMRNQFSDKEIFDNLFLGAGGHPRKTLKRLLGPCNADKASDELLKFIDINSAFSVQHVFESINDGIRTNGALVIEYFKGYPEFFADSDQLIFDGDWTDKVQFSTGEMSNVNHTLLVVGANLTGSDETMGGIKLFVQNSSKLKPFVTIGYDLLCSMGVNRLIAVEPGLSLCTEDYSFDPAAHLVQSGSPRYSKDDVGVPQDFHWGLDKPVETSVAEEDGATGTVPSHWDRIDPSTIGCIIGG
jgi:hypothetical protein